VYADDLQGLLNNITRVNECNEVVEEVDGGMKAAEEPSNTQDASSVHVIPHKTAAASILHNQQAPCGRFSGDELAVTDARWPWSVVDENHCHVTSQPEATAAIFTLCSVPAAPFLCL
jgi:hypothetical protein